MLPLVVALWQLCPPPQPINIYCTQVILLECTGNEQFVLPLMISLFCARIVGSLFNSDLYHIHIHLKKGVQFLDHELRSISGQHNLYAGHIMSREVVFLRPIERVSVVHDIF